MTTNAELATALDPLTRPTDEQLAEARMVLVDRLGEIGSETAVVLTEAVCEAFEAPSGAPLPDLAAAESDDPALAHVRWARAARSALARLVSDGEVTTIAEQTGDDQLPPEDVDDLGPAIAALAPLDEDVRYTLA